MSYTVGNTVFKESVIEGKKRLMKGCNCPCHEILRIYNKKMMCNCKCRVVNFIIKVEGKEISWKPRIRTMEE